MSTKEIISLLLALPKIKQFIVDTESERNRVSVNAKALYVSERIDFRVTSDETDDGRFLFYIKPEAKA